VYKKLFIIFFITLIIFISPQSYGPDINNYYKFNLDSPSLTRLPFTYFLYLSNQYIDLAYLTTVFFMLLLYFVKVENFGDIFILIILLIFMLFFSYAANSLLGNIIRQGIATIMLIAVLEYRSWLLRYFFLFNASIFHPGSVVAGLLFPQSTLKKDSILTFKSKVILGVVFISIVWLLVPDRVLNIMKRDIMGDLNGYVFVSFLIILRLSILFLTRNISQKEFIILCLGGMVFGVFGEFGQRILISLIFVLDYFVITRFYRSKKIVLFYITILFFEGLMRYFVIGNFWGPHAFKLS